MPNQSAYMCAPVQNLEGARPMVFIIGIPHRTSIFVRPSQDSALLEYVADSHKKTVRPLSRGATVKGRDTDLTRYPNPTMELAHEY